MTLIETLRPEARQAPPSGIVEVFNYGRGRPGLIPLWSGEGDEPTPPFIVEAATRSLAAGETFYTWQRGIPELRETLARYHTRLFGKPFTADHVTVTGGGMQAIQIAVAMTLGPGDGCLIPAPAWPNAAAAMGIRGAEAQFVTMDFGPRGFTLDLERLFAARTASTKALFLNSPANPTGWTATREELAAILGFARRHGLWIIADEIYTRFVYDEAAAQGQGRAPSLLDVMEEEDRVLFVNTMSKNWAMTGWRLGWVLAHPSLAPTLENMVQYSTSGVPVFAQRAAIQAIDKGEAYAEHLIERARRGRRILCEALAQTNRVRMVPPDGAFYLFFGIEGEPDVRRLGLRLVDEANVGLAPGTAFGPGGQGFMRACFLRSPAQMAMAAERLVTWLRGNS